MAVFRFKRGLCEKEGMVFLKGGYPNIPYVEVAVSFATHFLFLSSFFVSEFRAAFLLITSTRFFVK